MYMYVDMGIYVYTHENKTIKCNCILIQDIYKQGIYSTTPKSL